MGLKGIKNGKVGRTISTELGALSWLANSVSYMDESLIKFNQSTLDATIPALELRFKRRGPFERYKTMVSITKQLLIPFKIVPRFNPKVNMKNPAQSKLMSQQANTKNAEIKNMIKI